MKPTQEQVIAWAREAGFKPDMFGIGIWDSAEFNRFATLAYEAGRKDENEAAAKVCESLYREEWPDAEDYETGIEAIAIRARREQ